LLSTLSTRPHARFYLFRGYGLPRFVYGSYGGVRWTLKKNILIVVLLVVMAVLALDLKVNHAALRAARKDLDSAREQVENLQQERDRYREATQRALDLAAGYTAMFDWMVRNPTATVTSLPSEVKLKLGHPELFRP